MLHEIKLKNKSCNFSYQFFLNIKQKLKVKTWGSKKIVLITWNEHGVGYIREMKELIYKIKLAWIIDKLK